MIKLKGAAKAKKKIWGVMTAESKSRKIALMAAGRPLKEAAEASAPIDTGVLRKGFAIKTHVTKALVQVGVRRNFKRRSKVRGRRITKRPARYLHLAEAKHGFLEQAKDQAGDEALARYATKLREELLKHAASG